MAVPPALVTVDDVTCDRPIEWRVDAGPKDMGLALRTTAKRLAILTDIVKTANSILEPRKVVDLVMAKIQQLVPSEAWSMLLVDEERQELTFELALGEKGKDVSSFRVKIGEGVAGWVAQTGKPTIVNMKNNLVRGVRAASDLGYSCVVVHDACVALCAREVWG